MSASKFGALIRERRRAMNKTQEDAAAFCNVSTPYIGLVEAGKRRPAPQVLKALSVYLNLNVAALARLAYPDYARLFDHSKAKTTDQVALRDAIQMLHLQAERYFAAA